MGSWWNAWRRSQTRVEENHTARHNEKVGYLATDSSGWNRRARYSIGEHTTGRCSFLKFVRTARANSIGTTPRLQSASPRCHASMSRPTAHSRQSLTTYVQNTLSSQFLSPDAPAWKAERAVECNVLLDVAPNANSATGGCSPKGQDRYHRNLCPPARASCVTGRRSNLSEAARRMLENWRT